MTLSVFHLLVLFSTVLFCLGLKYILAKPFYQLSESSVRQLDIIMDKTMDEDTKDSLILKNLAALLKIFFAVLILLLLVIGLSIVPVILYQQLRPEAVIDTSSIYFYGSMFIGSFSILFFKQKSDYSYWSKLLHTIILDNYSVGKFLFSKEKNKGNNLSGDEGENFVIVSGLARAGTTALARMIYTPEVFHSTKYANMPFILAPNFWKRFYNPKVSKEKQRAHGDNVMHSETSIEAMEEYFFKAHLNDDYIKDESLLKHEINEELYLEYLAFQNLFKDGGKETIFLAKNNNLILRLESLRRLNQNFKVILLFRNPMDHAKSLLNQHLNFKKQQKEDPFTLKYMNWLGHHEFGLNQKFFDLENGIDFSRYDKDELNYWLLSWLNYYESIIKLMPDSNIIMVQYSDLLAKPNILKKALAKRLELELKGDKIDPFKPSMYSATIDADDAQLDQELKIRIEKVFTSLKAQKLELG